MGAAGAQRVVGKPRGGVRGEGGAGGGHEKSRAGGHERKRGRAGAWDADPGAREEEEEEEEEGEEEEEEEEEEGVGRRRRRKRRRRTNASAWMTGNLFVEWLKDWDHKLGRERATAADIAKKISLLDSILMLRDAWADVGASTIRNCWKKGGLVMAPEEKPNTVDPPAEVSAEEFEQWITADDNTPVSEPVTVEDFIAEVRERFAGAEAAGSNVGNEEEEEEEGEETAMPSPTEMRNAIQILKTGLLHVGFNNFELLHQFAKEANMVLDKAKTQASLDKFVK
ncbi:hypothetical protein CRUP_005584 [Coryphaenoides rupestris]|nr:hypothetical protein CRUP_005584 [Coryphaenoides rupestris]